ncbi:MAG: hypothetical protein JWM88_294 [Verrucomicrobia bacterium]|nr:hypothetical protein [Verrucomicrobiota bacterium]
MIATKPTSLKRDRRVREVRARVAHAPPWARRIAWTVATVLVVCVVLDLIASPVARSVVNRRLAAMPEYTGNVGRIRLSLWRGRCEADDFVFQKRGASGPPLVHIKSSAVNIAYLKLVTGKLSGEITVDQMEVTVVKTEPAPSKKDKKSAPPPKAERWQDRLQKTFPMELTRVDVKNSRVMFVDQTHQPALQAGILQFHLRATGLKTKPAKGVDLPAEVVVDGTTSGQGHLTLRVQADPAAETPRFHAQFAVTGVNLPELNDVLLAYAKADVARGTFEFESEVTAQGGAYNGYVKPFFKDLDFKTVSDKDKSPMQLLAKKAVSAVTQVFKNKSENKVATKAPISGNFEKNNVDVWTTVANLFRNAFVQAIREGFEGR